MIPYWFLIVRGLIEESLERDETGQTLVEYGLILVLIAVVVISAVILLGVETNALYQRVINAWPGQ